jgi:predicted dehydrogenase
MDQDIAWAEENLVPYGVAVYRTSEEMIRHAGLEAIVIASPTKFHYEQVIAGIQHSLHVLCEKPPATTAEQTRKISSSRNKEQYAHLQVMTAYSQRFDASDQNATRAIRGRAHRHAGHGALRKSRWIPTIAVNFT